MKKRQPAGTGRRSPGAFALIPGVSALRSTGCHSAKIQEVRLTGVYSILKAAKLLPAEDQKKIADALKAVEAIAEAWAVDRLGMMKARRGTHGIDGVLPNGRRVQVKSKKAGAHTDSQTYVPVFAKTLERADDLLVVFVDQRHARPSGSSAPFPLVRSNLAPTANAISTTFSRDTPAQTGTRMRPAPILKDIR